MLDDTQQGEYDALMHDIGLVPLRARTVIEVTGDDRATFLHNLCTNEVKSIGIGEGREAFVTNVQGKTIGHIVFAVDADRILIHTVADQYEFLFNHLDRYLITEDVQLNDRSDALTATVVAGPKAIDAVVRSRGSNPVERAYAHGTIEIEGISVFIQSVPVVATDCLLGLVATESHEAFMAALVQSGAKPISEDVLHIARIENGYPLFGIDVTEKNLPQEVARDSLAISFTKGCYLGQETVARIDALGHVNRKLTRLRFEGEPVPESGSPIVDAEGESVGTITSACYSPMFQSPLGLAYVRAKSLELNGLSCCGQSVQIVT